MPPRAAAQASFGTRAWNFVYGHKRDFFFASVAVFALGTVVRREMIGKGVVRAPEAPNTQIHPRVERKFGQQKSS